jgi:hypothetical protein
MNRYGITLCQVVLAGAGLAAAQTPASAAETEPFKITNIHFETNASACDMGIQMSFDTDGVSELTVKDPNGQIVYEAGSVGGPAVTHEITEGFQERVEPQIRDLIRALGCERDPEEPAVFLTDLLSAWPEGSTRSAVRVKTPNGAASPRSPTRFRQVPRSSHPKTATSSRPTRTSSSGGRR